MMKNVTNDSRVKKSCNELKLSKLALALAGALLVTSELRAAALDDIADTWTIDSDGTSAVDTLTNNGGDLYIDPDNVNPATVIIVDDLQVNGATDLQNTTVTGLLDVTSAGIVADDDVVITVDNDNLGGGQFIVQDSDGANATVDVITSDAYGTNITASSGDATSISPANVQGTSSVLDLVDDADTADASLVVGESAGTGNTYTNIGGSYDLAVTSGAVNDEVGTETATMDALATDDNNIASGVTSSVEYSFDYLSAPTVTGTTSTFSSGIWDFDDANGVDDGGVSAGMAADYSVDTTGAATASASFGYWDSTNTVANSVATSVAGVTMSADDGTDSASVAVTTTSASMTDGTATIETTGGVATAGDATTLTSVDTTTNTVSMQSSGGNNSGHATLSDTLASLTYTDATGDSHGITVNATQTTISGGTASTTETLSDAGVTFVDSTNGQTFAVSNTADATIGDADTAGSLAITNGAGGNSVFLDGVTNTIVGTTSTQISNGAANAETITVGANSVAIVTDGGTASLSDGTNTISVDGTDAQMANGSVNVTVNSTTASMTDGTTTISTTGGVASTGDATTYVSVDTTTNTIDMQSSGGNNSGHALLSDTEASLTFVDANGDEHGITVDGTQTVISGGTNSSVWTLADGDAGGAELTVAGSTSGAAKTLFQATTNATTTTSAVTIGEAGNSVNTMQGSTNDIVSTVSIGLDDGNGNTVDMNNTDGVKVVSDSEISLNDGNGNTMVLNNAGGVNVDSDTTVTVTGATSVALDTGTTTNITVTDASTTMNETGSGNMVRVNSTDARMVNGTGTNTVVVTSTGTTITADSDATVGNGRGVVSVAEDQASMTVVNPTSGVAHGVAVYQDYTTVSGGVSSTYMTMYDDRVQFGNADDGFGGATGDPVRVTGVKDGSHPYDAVNFQQLEKAYSGVASVAAMAAVPEPREGRDFSLGAGYGNYMGQGAIAIGFNANVSDRSRIKAAIGHSNGETSSSIGFGYSW